MQAGYTGLSLDASAVDQLSKYVLDYAPHSLTVAASIPLPGDVRVAPRLEYRERRRPYAQPNATVAVEGRDYALLDLRVGRRFASRYELFVEGTNLFDVAYQEVAGVAMPGAAWSVSLAIGAR